MSEATDYFDAIEAAGRSYVGRRTMTAAIGAYKVILDPPYSLASSAEIDQDVYSLARMISSENGSEKAPYLLALAETTRNYATRSGVSVTTLLTRSKVTAANGLYSEQAAGKWASTRLDPEERHVAAARIALVEGSTIFGHPIDFFDPRSADAGTQGTHTTVPSESYIARNASNGLQWVGDREGIDPYHLMLFEKASDVDTQPALDAVQAGRDGTGGVYVADDGPDGSSGSSSGPGVGGLVVALAIAGVAGLAVYGVGIGH